ncbi:MAG: hypothetical protein CMH52_14365 [Myxococcales bacterium]|nr:hypothetical protein [Myxococcales bacterium]|tara:strand:- start:951 stop:1190 length:240 start_codon:yes stop_codon:yes gene_type:complete
MSKRELQSARNIIGRFVEDCGADAVVVLYSKVKRSKTETYVIPFGNAHTCGALIDYAYEYYEAPDLLNLEIEDKDEDDE